MSKTRRGFTLVELLAVIVILAIILVIAVPQIMNTIDEARRAAFISSARLIAESAENMKLSNDTIGASTDLQCPDVSKISASDYKDCTIEFVEGEAYVTIVGKGKFEGMSICSATRETAEVKSECSTDIACFSYEKLVSNFDINKESCKTYFSGQGPDDMVESICTGGDVNGMTIRDMVEDTSSVEELETAGVISNVQYGLGITGYSDKCPKSVVIPNKINNESVTSIGSLAFISNNLTSVTIPDSVVSIGKGAFQSNNLTSVTIPDSVVSIGVAAFAGNKLTSVTIPNSVTSIGCAAFNTNELEDEYAYIYKRNSDGSIDNTHVVSYGGVTKNITIPNGVTTIGNSAFEFNNITSVSIPDSVISIGAAAFQDNQLTSVTIPNNVTTLGLQAFRDNQLTSVTIPNSVTTIGESAFMSNKLTGVTIPNSVTTIGMQAFRDNQLTSVTIPNSVTTIGNKAFYKTTMSNPNLTSIINTTGRSFDWDGIITGTSGTSSITGTYKDVNVTTE